VNPARKMYLFITSGFCLLVYSLVLYFIVFRSYFECIAFPPVNSYRATNCRNVRLGVLKGEKGRRWRMREG
jgi:hypothetical protein